MAWDWGSAGGGAASGALMGSQVMPGWGTAIGGLLGGLGGGMMGGGGQPAEPGGWNWLQNPQYSFTEPRLRLTSDFITQNLNRINQGQFPAWYEGISPLLRKEQKKGLQETYYGGGFGPGVLESTQAYDVARGTGRGASAGRNYGTQLQKYAEQSNSIDEYISKMGYEAQREGAYQFPQMSMQMQGGPQGQWGQYGPTEASPSGGQQVMSSIMSMLPYMTSMNKKNTVTPDLSSALSGLMEPNDVTRMFNNYPNSMASGTAPYWDYNSGYQDMYNKQASIPEIPINNLLYGGYQHSPMTNVLKMMQNYPQRPY